MSKSLDDVDDGLLGDLSKAFGGGSAFADKGTGLLGSLLGSGTVGDLAGVIGRFAGLGGGASSSLLGMLAPVILGSLKKQSRDARLDATGLANLLKGQQANISGAMPGNLADMLSGVQGLSGMADWAKGSAGAAVRTGQAAAGRAVDRAAAAAPAASGSKWLLPLLAAIVLAGLLWYFWPKAKPATTDLMPPAVTQGVDAVTTVTKDVTDLFNRATADFTGITDAASAQAALPRLRDLATQFGDLSEDIQAIPAVERTAVTTAWDTAKATLMSLIDKVLALPGVRDVIGPVVDEIRTKLG